MQTSSDVPQCHRLCWLLHLMSIFPQEQAETYDLSDWRTRFHCLAIYLTWVWTQSSGSAQTWCMAPSLCNSLRLHFWMHEGFSWNAAWGLKRSRTYNRGQGSSFHPWPLHTEISLESLSFLYGNIYTYCRWWKSLQYWKDWAFGGCTFCTIIFYQLFC